MATLNFGNVVKDTFTTAIKNAASVIVAALLWIVTIWVPFINVGTTIALFYGMPLEMSRGNIMNPLAIFDGKYRKYMGEFFSIVGLMGISLIPAFIFMIVPGIIISIGWCLAILLLVDKEMNPAEAMTTSTKFTYGNKWTIFLSRLVIYILFIIAFMIVSAIFNAINVSFLTFIVTIAMIAVGLTLDVAFNSVLYRDLVLNRDGE